jgi:hypothetical protein
MAAEIFISGFAARCDDGFNRDLFCFRVMIVFVRFRFFVMLSPFSYAPLLIGDISPRSLFTLISVHR